MTEKRIFTPRSDFAIRAHEGQTYGRKPYEFHLLQVVNTLLRFHDWDELTQDEIDAAWGHDLLEDTETTTNGLALADFSLRSIELISAVTNEPGKNRKKRAELTYPKIRTTRGAIKLKLADRIANIEQAVSFERLGRRPGSKFDMYESEWSGFQEALRNRCTGETHAAIAMWSHLDRLFDLGRQQRGLYST